MSTPSVTPLSDADLDEVCARLARAGRPWTPDRLRWRLSPPAGTGRIALDDRLSAAVLSPLAVAVDGHRRTAWQVVDAVGPDAAFLLEAVLGDLDGPVLALGPRPAGRGWRAAADLRTWTTGPDPFVPLQEPVDAPGDRHDALGEALARRAGVGPWRDAAWLRWAVAGTPEARLMEVCDGEACAGWILCAPGRLRGLRSIRVLDLQATDRDVHYALLKAARRLSWEQGSRPVVLRGEVMSRRYAFTAGYLPAGPPLVRRPFRVHVHGEAPDGPWRAWSADAAGP